MLEAAAVHFIATTMEHETIYCVTSVFTRRNVSTIHTVRGAFPLHRKLALFKSPYLQQNDKVKIKVLS